MSDWIENEGSDYPPLMRVGDEIAVRLRDNCQLHISESEAAEARWTHRDRHDDIMAYRILPAVPASPDELHKAHSRIEELERKVGTLIEENQALRKKLPSPRMPRVAAKLGSEVEVPEDRIEVINDKTT